jgi:atlastin
MPEPKSMLEATAEANNLTAVASVKDSYISAMEEICGGDRPFMNPKSLETKHQGLRIEALEDFDRIPKMGGREFSQSYREKLEIELDQAFEHFEAQNKSKNMFRFVFNNNNILIFFQTFKF